ncbi:hypothetical protein B0H15DRAFT_870593 [Mycena belliarum]|uniref:Uncharacterized protein n=1 Tax=Mycena belliarum TaxID=1033014 RepID=A0AAD6TNU1_9AGAR|nr:hypothetical protein B0H15DRAFT_870593 [Mycena belliae]
MSSPHRASLSSLEVRYLGMTLGVTVPAILLTVLLLGSTAYLACKRVSRRHLNRVSFRLLIYAVIANLGFIVVIPVDVLQYRYACAPVSFVRQFCLLFSACMSFCIMLNLELVLIHGNNGHNMEKYYLIGSFLLCLVCTVAPQAAGTLGWFDRTTRDCFLRNPNVPHGLAWLVGTQSFWLLFMAASQAALFGTIIIFMVQHELKRRQPLKNGVSIDELLVYRESPMVKYRDLILRIALYPILSCIFSAISTVITTVAMSNPSANYSPLIPILGPFIFLVRPLLFVVLAAADPGYVGAVGALRAQRRVQATAHSFDSTDGAAQKPANRYSERFFVALGRGSVNTGRASTATERSVENAAELPPALKGEEKAGGGDRGRGELDIKSQL